MRDYGVELKNRVAFIQRLLAESGAAGIVYGNSGGKDSALVGILCKKACDNTVGVILPCQSKVNFGTDMSDGLLVADQFAIETRTVDLSDVKASLVKALDGHTELNKAALSNIAPRLRMTALYAVAAAENRMVAGTGNRSEIHMGYFTKWGDGGHDFNPISDLTATQVFEFLKYLGAPKSIIEKAPSAGLFEGQTDEADMGITYKKIDEYLETGKASAKDLEIIHRYHNRSQHKRRLPATFQ